MRKQQHPKTPTGPFFARKGSFCVEAWGVTNRVGRFDLHVFENVGQARAEALYERAIELGWPVQILDHNGVLVRRSCEVEVTCG